MQVTKQYLKQLIMEELEEIENKGNDSADKETSSQDKFVTSQQLKNKIRDAAKNVSGIVKNELDIVEFALALLDQAKSANLNSATLRARLQAVQRELEKLSNV